VPCNFTAQALTRLISAESSSELTCQATVNKEGRYITRTLHTKKHTDQATRSLSETKTERYRANSWMWRHQAWRVQNSAWPLNHNLACVFARKPVMQLKCD